MCRKNHLMGCTIAAFGLGILVGHCMESGFLCFWGGLGLLLLGFCTIQKKHRF